MLSAYHSLANTALSFYDPLGLGRAALDYWRDSIERQVLFLDVMRQRGNQYLEHMEQTKPNVLGFDAEILMDGRELPRPVNYELLRIQPPEGVEIDPDMRPFVVVDPRAGHGPGIGGFKPDSEIGVALRAGHPCYFIGFLPFPVQGQTVEDVADAEIAFLREINTRHSHISEKPMVVGNCQAGWQLMMAAALEPECFGPILIAGAPLSYWAGERGKAPMRYSAGMTGGSWLTAFASDLGAGLFDGAWLVQNFEKLNPANTLWTKQYRLYANVDEEAERYLNFERWWGGHVVLGGEEIQYIVDNLFVGNRLSCAKLTTRDGRRIDLRNVRSPIVVFCSQGDDITPPPQALGWIRDLYADVDDIQAHEQTIVYCVHDSTGHLGIFVSGNVSRKEHAEFTANMDYIDVLPPGLYETQVTEKAAQGARESAHIDGDYLLEFSPRTLEDVEEIVMPIDEDERRFATVERVSQINLGIYQMMVQPWMQAIMTPSAARWIRRMHPIRLGYKLFSDRNPLMVPVPVMAEIVKRERHVIASDNTWRILEGMVSDQIAASLDAYRRQRDQMTETLFMQLYGQPWLQTMVGLGATAEPLSRRPGIEPEHRRFIAARKSELTERIEEGGSLEAVLRALIYILGGAPATDERNFQRLKASREEFKGELDLAAFKALVRDQFFILRMDRKAALDALPAMLTDASNAEIDADLAHIEHVLAASGPLSEHAAERLAAVREQFDRARPSPSSGQ
ncbi:DUF3141 domain-containing protein [Aidingimonas halophila]|uniref:Poly(3-hydroxyalkanoate) synthetase n=1 Tax=Aidingimonas halophila TaxID=574349 RepID=A0A1H3B1M9_9GAMM|nr:DUF3141 domain-containing protein [Aidingimonas halophila]GHC25616.1 hypothetical protein GCM10008094_15910 [Aidingimonas halophila]SDX34969.1 Protein of unknown function [Aidingimonas halophila]